MEDKDIRHLEWVYERMKDVHYENDDRDYMIRFREILETLRQPAVVSEFNLNKMTAVQKLIEVTDADRRYTTFDEFVGYIVSTIPQHLFPDVKRGDFYNTVRDCLKNDGIYWYLEYDKGYQIANLFIRNGEKLYKASTMTFNDLVSSGVGKLIDLVKAETKLKDMVESFNNNSMYKYELTPVSR